MDRLDQLKNMLEDDPKDNFLLFAIAMEHMTRENIHEAITAFTTLKTVNEDYVGLYYHLAECYSEIEEYENAIDAYQKGIKVAEKINDQHAKAELMNAKMNLELEM